VSGLSFAIYGFKKTNIDKSDKSFRIFNLFGDPFIYTTKLS